MKIINRKITWTKNLCLSDFSFYYYYYYYNCYYYQYYNYHNIIYVFPFGQV